MLKVLDPIFRLPLSGRKGGEGEGKAFKLRRQVLILTPLPPLFLSVSLSLLNSARQRGKAVRRNFP